MSKQAIYSENTDTESPENKPIKDFSSSHTQSMAQLLTLAQSSLLVSTYQSGRLIIIRAENNSQLNTHFTLLNKPMGLATDNNRFALGVRNEIIEYQNIPSVGNKLDTKAKEARPHDACYLPRFRDITGDIDIHEMSYDKDGKLWFINTRFSCLCSQSTNNSFEPEWRPKFIDRYTPQDLCHLNGLAMRDGKPRYVTALGQSNLPGGWRENKRDGGILIDIENHRIITQGLSMPHSPRWYRDELWLLESGYGALIKIDIQTGEKKHICSLPGFTRGLCFIDDIAFIGLSKVRESNTFGGLPLTESDEERHCGVWAVNIQTGDSLGFLQFSGDVEEIFAVETLQGQNFPSLLDLHDPLINTSYVLSDEALKDVDFSALTR